MAKQKARILVVDDNSGIRAALKLLLPIHFVEVELISSPKELMSKISSFSPDVVLLDMNFHTDINTGNEGLFWLSEIKSKYEEIEVVLFTAYADIALAVEGMKRGAFDFIVKPWDNEKLIATLKMAVQLNISKKMVTELSERETELKREINKERRDIIGSSPGLLNIMNMVRKVARTDANVLITGENGTGKELIAREIHRLSARTKEILVTVDMGAISESLFESELFGHTKGSFTDAHENRAGKFETANKGTLFLDEIGNLSFHLQAKILAALENRQISRIGSNQLIPIDIRLICATNKNLDKMVSEGLFRQDLLYRINTIQIEIPPLRERGNDITILAEYFLNKYSRKYNKPNLKINQQANEKLLRYSWPGNIRELQHTLEKAVILSESDILRPEDFYLKTIDISEKSKTLPTLEEMERQLIHQALEINKGNYSAAAEKLGITRQTLYNKLKKMDQ